MKRESQPSVTACFTGHRPEKLPKALIPQIKLSLDGAVNAAVRGGITHFICGMSRGFDTMAAYAVIEARSAAPGLILEAALPCIDQTAKWSKSDRAEYEYLLQQADVVTCLHPEYISGCMHRRNEYMISASRLLIACYDGSQSGGTAHTVRLAQKGGVEIVNVYPAVKEGL